MARFRKINTQAKTDINTGFGTNAADYGGRFLNKDGTPNIGKKGLNWLEGISTFHYLLALPRWKFLLLIFLFYISINLVFAIVYYLIGIEHLGGVITTSRWEQFGEAFFFSAQTFTTVGYGRINPTGFLASGVAAFEALLGLLSLALATGLLYGRFSRPRAYIRFSEKALISPYKDGIALTVRLVPYKNNLLLNVEARISMGMLVEENGKATNRFYSLPLELDKINALPLSWTLVHPINSESPLYQFSEEDFMNLRGEFMVYIQAFDDMFSNMVMARTSYTFHEVVYGAKFIPMYHASDRQEKTVIDIDKLNQYDKVPLPDLISQS